MSPFTTSLDMPRLSVILVPAVVVLLIAIGLRHYRTRGRLPPGPTPLPILGNILHVPRTSVGLTFSALTKKYGASSNLIVYRCTSIPTDMLYARRYHVLQSTRSTDDRARFLQGGFGPFGQTILQLLWTSCVNGHETVCGPLFLTILVMITTLILFAGSAWTLCSSSCNTIYNGVSIVARSTCHSASTASTNTSTFN